MRMLAIFGVCVVVAVGIHFSDAQKTYCEEHLGEATAKQEGNHCFFKAAGSENALDLDGDVYSYNMSKVKDLCEKTNKGHLPRLSQKEMTTAERKAFYDLARATDNKAFWITDCKVKAIDELKITVECGFGEEESATSNAFGDSVPWAKTAGRGLFVYYDADDASIGGADGTFVNSNQTKFGKKNKDKMPVMCHQIKTVATATATTITTMPPAPEPTGSPGGPSSKASVNGVGTMATALIVIVKAIVAFVM